MVSRDRIGAEALKRAEQSNFIRRENACSSLHRVFHSWKTVSPTALSMRRTSHRPGPSLLLLASTKSLPHLMTLWLCVHRRHSHLPPALLHACSTNKIGENHSNTPGNGLGQLSL